MSSLAWGASAGGRPDRALRSPRALNGRAGSLSCSLSKSDERRSKQRACAKAAMRAACERLASLVAKNLIKCNLTIVGWRFGWKDPEDCQQWFSQPVLRPPGGKKNFFPRPTPGFFFFSNRMVFQVRQASSVWRGKRHWTASTYFLELRRVFTHSSSTPEQPLADMTEAFAWLPKSAYGPRRNRLKTRQEEKPCVKSSANLCCYRFFNFVLRSGEVQ